MPLDTAERGANIYQFPRRSFFLAWLNSKPARASFGMVVFGGDEELGILLTHPAIGTTRSFWGALSLAAAPSSNAPESNPSVSDLHW
jgi:hypothetical protein